MRYLSARAYYLQGSFSSFLVALRDVRRAAINHYQLSTQTHVHTRENNIVYARAPAV